MRYENEYSEEKIHIRCDTLNSLFRLLVLVLGNAPLESVFLPEPIDECVRAAY